MISTGRIAALPYLDIIYKTFVFKGMANTHALLWEQLNNNYNSQDLHQLARLLISMMGSRLGLEFII